MKFKRFPLCLCMLWIYRMTSLVSCCARIVNQNKWPTLLHDRTDVKTRYMKLLWFIWYGEIRCRVKPKSKKMILLLIWKANRIKEKEDWLARNQDNVSGLGDMFIRGRFSVSVSYHYTNPAKRVGLVQSRQSLSSHRM